MEAVDFAFVDSDFLFFSLKNSVEKGREREKKILQRFQWKEKNSYFFLFFAYNILNITIVNNKTVQEDEGREREREKITKYFTSIKTILRSNYIV